MDIYDNSKSYQEFFDLLKKDEDITICYKRYNWIERLFIINDMVIPKYWIIDMDLYSSSSFVTITNIE